MTSQSGFRGLPVNGGTPREIAEVVNRMLTNGTMMPNGSSMATAMGHTALPMARRQASR